MSISLDSDQARHFVGPDLDQNCLRSLSADDTFMERVYNGTFRIVEPSNGFHTIFGIMKGS